MNEYDSDTEPEPGPIAGLKSEDEIAHEQAIQRMEDGLTDLLKRHSPNELSSICGVLHLKSLERAHNSIQQIISFAKQDNQISEIRIQKILSTLWEGTFSQF